MTTYCRGSDGRNGLRGKDIVVSVAVKDYSCERLVASGGEGALNLRAGPGDGRFNGGAYCGSTGGGIEDVVVFAIQFVVSAFP